MLSGLGVLGDEKTSKNIVEILSSLAAIDEKKLEKSMNALNKLAASLNNIKINKDTTNGLKAITGVFTVFKDIKVTTIMSLWMASKVMKPKTGKAISGFLIALFDPLAKKNYDSKLIKGVADLMDAIGKMVLKLSIAIGILALIAALDIKNLLIATGIVVGIVITLLTITQLIAILPAKMLAKGLDGLDHIAKCVLYLSVAIGLLALLVTIFDVETIMVGTGIVMGIVTSLLLLVTKLASKDKKTLAAGGEVIEQISSLLFKMVIAIGIIALLIKIFDMSTIIVGTLIVMGIFTVLVFGVYKLAGVDEKQLKSASKLVKSMTLMLLVVSLLALFVFVPISAQSKEVLLGAAIVLGVITIMGLIAIGLVWAIEKVGGEKGVSDICKVLMTLTIIITVVSLLALFVFPGIAKQSGDVIIGGLIVLGVVTLLSGIALLVYWAVQAIGGETGVKDICILLGTLTGVVTVISIIALFVFPGIAQKAGDVIIGGLVALGIVTVLSAIALGVYYFT